MCVTEVWSFRECGCFYNHSVLCRDFQDQSSPCFAPNIQYPIARWLHDTAVNSGVASKQCGQQARTAEYQNCPNHRTVQKSFLNQICEDCLLEELESEPRRPENAVATYEFPSIAPGNEEGMIWDSEVKIEIESLVSVPPNNAIFPNRHPLAQDCTEEDDKRIFDSHVEITVEADNRIVPAEDISSPPFTASRRNHHSRTSSDGTSPASTHYSGVHLPSSPRYQIKHNERDIPRELSDFDDADDEKANRTSPYPHHTRHVTRGRPLTRPNLHNVQECKPDAGTKQEPFSVKTTGQARSRFQGLRCLSTTFLPGVRPQATENEQKPPIWQMTTSASSKPLSKNTFGSIRGRKSSPLLGSAALSVPASSREPINATNISDVTNADAREKRLGLPRKSTLRDFALFLTQDLKCTPTTRSPSDKQPSDTVRSATAIRSSSEIDDQKGFQKDAENDSMSETVFESDSRVTSLRSEGSLSIKADDEVRAFSILPGIPRSSTMNTLHAVINDLSLGLDKQDISTTNSSAPTAENALTHCQIGDVTELAQITMPRVNIQQKRVQNRGHIQNGEERGLYVSWSTSLKSRTRTGLAPHLD